MSCTKSFPSNLPPVGLSTFVLSRGRDASGVSGTGPVLEGVIFHDGTIAIHWLTPYQSVTFFRDFDTFLHIHIFSHPDNDAQMTFWTGHGVVLTWSQDG